MVWAQRTGGFLFALLCSCQPQDNLRPRQDCASRQCPEGSTCLIDRCVKDGSIGQGEPCTDEAQCNTALSCRNFVCAPGCSRVYTIDDCGNGLWCKPQSEIPPYGGECSASECDPQTNLPCLAGQVCVAFAPGVGSCMDYCDYGFVGSSFVDNCVDLPGADRSCESVGIDYVPVCLPKAPASGPTIGYAGCDGIANPCMPGAVCVDVVCRKLCRQGQANSCSPGEACISVQQRDDLFYCRAQ